MEKEKDLLETTENVEEQTTEETVEGAPAAETEVEEKRYTDEEVNQIVAKRVARKEAKLRKEFEGTLASYREAEHVLNAGLGTSSIEEATTNLKDFYKEKGVDIPQYQPSYSDDDMRVLANNEAQKIIEYGFEDVEEEVDRLAAKGLENMTAREKLVFNQLAEYRKSELDRKELAQIGVGEDALNDSEFIEFSKDLNPNLSVKDKYELFLKYKPKPQIKQIGSLKGNKTEEPAVKDFYSYEESLKFTKKDFDENPALYAAVQNSMRKWRK